MCIWVQSHMNHVELFPWDLEVLRSMGGEVSSNQNQPGTYVITPIKMWNSLCQIGADLNLLVGPARCTISSVTFGVLYCITTVSSWVSWVHGAENRVPLLISLETTLSPLSCGTFPSYFIESYLPSSTNMYILCFTTHDLRILALT